MALSIVSILSFGAFAYARWPRPCATRSAFENIGGQDLSARARGQEETDDSPSGCDSLIAQMLEWNWDSVSAECTSFLGPAEK